MESWSDGIIHKGACDTLEEAQTAAEERAETLAAFYADIGSARAIPLSECLLL